MSRSGVEISRCQESARKAAQIEGGCRIRQYLQILWHHLKEICRRDLPELLGRRPGKMWWCDENAQSSVQIEGGYRIRKYLQLLWHHLRAIHRREPPELVYRRRTNMQRQPTNAPSPFKKKGRSGIRKYQLVPLRSLNKIYRGDLCRIKNSVLTRDMVFAKDAGTENSKTPQSRRRPYQHYAHIPSTNSYTYTTTRQ